MRIRTLLAGVVAASAALAGPAQAHEGNPNFSSEVTAVVPDVAGLEVEIVDFDDSMLVRNRTGETVVIQGYRGEPYVRMEPDGTVEVNEASPTYFLNQDRFGETPVPEGVDASDPPEWRLDNERGEYTWHDHRIHYMGEGTPTQVADESKRTKVFDYEVPLLVGDEKVEVLGTLYWVGVDDGLPAAPFIALAALAVIGAAAILVVRRRRGPRAPADEGEEAW